MPQRSVLDRPHEGTHLAVLYVDPADRDITLIPYLARALARGEGAVCVTADGDELRSQVRRESDGPDEVEIVATADSYLRDGRFSAGRMVDWMSDLTAAAPLGTDARRLCIAGMLDWAGGLNSAEAQDLHRYESSIDRLASTSRHTLACYYDLRSLPVRDVVTVLRTHAQVILGGTAWDNPFYERSEGRQFA